MIVLLGEFNGKSRLIPDLQRYGWGRMWASYGPAWSYDGEPWGFDNGAWSAFTKQTPFDGERFQRRMQRAIQKAVYPPAVAVVPDIVQGARDSLVFSLEWLSRCNAEWPWFLAVQDGLTQRDVEPVVERFDGLFLGGSDELKGAAARWCRLAHDYGRLFHFGRCNREQWIRNAIEIGADSIDTTRPIRAATGGEPAAYRRFIQLVTGQCPQKSFEFHK